MRNFEERKAEVFRRSEIRIKARRRKRIYFFSCTASLCICVCVVASFLQSGRGSDPLDFGLDGMAQNEQTQDYPTYAGSIKDDSAYDDAALGIPSKENPFLNNSNQDGTEYVPEDFSDEYMQNGAPNDIADPDVPGDSIQPQANGATAQDSRPTTSPEGTPNGQNQFMTVTIYFNDNTSYALSYVDSVAVLDVLENLEYDENKVTKCVPEYRIKSTQGAEYGISISAKYARCEKGQAILTSEHIEILKFYIPDAKQNIK